MSEFHLTDALSSLSAELCTALALYSTALTEPCGLCIADISECNRRSASLAADTHARLYAAFCPPLPRTQCAALCEALHDAIEQVFGASMLLSAGYHPSARLDTVVGGLVRMGEMIRHEVEMLPRLVKNRSVIPPDTYAYHAELTRARAALALYLTHSERSTAEHLAMQGAVAVIAALSHSYEALLSLIAEAI